MCNYYKMQRVIRRVEARQSKATRETKWIQNRERVCHKLAKLVVALLCLLSAETTVTAGKVIHDHVYPVVVEAFNTTRGG